MKLSLHPMQDMKPHASAASQVLADWYARHAVVLRLWAIRPYSVGHAMRVILMLEPSIDGNEISPAWMAKGAGWARDLQQKLDGAVQLERLDGPLPEEFEIEGEGVLHASLCWRDSTLPQH